jgi:fatty-acyl-CoA synthase
MNGMTDRAASAESWRRALELTAPLAQHPSVTLPVVIDRLAEMHGDRLALLGDGESLTYRALADRTRRYARGALAQGIRPGDVVCLMMPNCPGYLAIWLGITRVGGVVALLNTNLVGDALRHAIDIVAPTHALIDARFASAFAEVRPRLARAPDACVIGGDAGDLPSFADCIDAPDDTPVDHPLPTLRDPALYIYTSGTTGLPKAARVSHHRIMQWSHWFAGLAGVEVGDRMYNCLPMYHSIGGVVATCAPLIGGGSVLICERFSASRFWDDVAEHGCTLFQYIGELCRYLVSAPPHPREAAHRLRLALGNGLRAEIWYQLQERFRIPRIIEFYAATEASFSLFNCDGKPGAIGRIPPFMAHRFPVALVKLDDETGEPLRGTDGLCVRCAADEPGEALGKLADDASGGGAFEGYTDSTASERKVLRNVFSIGDAWYRTGDLMRKDRGGYFYFVDRLGDTFRWKGENVSTAEVEEVVGACPGVAEAVVFGVAVPGADGRAGMVAIVPMDGFDPARFAAHLSERLPDYARPLFLRLCREIAATGTFKPQKRAFAEAGFDPAATDDPIYVFDRAMGGFVPLDAPRHTLLQQGKMRL